MASVRSTVCMFQPFEYVTGVTIQCEPNGKTEPFIAYAIVICPEPDMPFMPLNLTCPLCPGSISQVWSHITLDVRSTHYDTAFVFAITTERYLLRRDHNNSLLLSRCQVLTCEYPWKLWKLHGGDCTSCGYEQAQTGSHVTNTTPPAERLEE